MDRGLFNIILMGISFLLIFTAFQTGAIIQKNVVQAINSEYNKAWNGKEWNAYNSLAILYAVFSLANWIAPSTVALLGPKVSMILSALTYCFFVANFLHPVLYGLTSASIIMGVGAGVIWTAQGNFLTINSNHENISRNTGIFWCLFQGSLLFGNIFVYFQFQGQENIDSRTRTITYTVLTSAALLGTFLLCFLRKVEPSSSSSSKKSTGPLEAICNSFKLLKTEKMMLLCLVFFYTGLEISFYSGIYSASIGFVTSLGKDRTKYAGISGILIGAGEIIGGAAFSIFGKRTLKCGRDSIIFLGYLLHMISFAAIYINMPPDASIQETSQLAYIPTSLTIALACSFLLGLGDSCFNNIINSLIGSVYQEDSSPAFAIFKFIQSLATAMAFFYSNYITIDIHMYILSTFATIGTLAFFAVERTSKIEKAGSTSSISEPPSAGKPKHLQSIDSQITLVVD
ncbi:UNC93-like protein MFSD11 isoform X2 [Brevipalpus obovatus]